jgi:hypothetical protein
MSNPYLSRGPVRDPALLFGREHELQEIAAFIRGTQSVSIVGPRKIGKTSLLMELMRPAAWAALGLSAENLFVYVDCEVLGEGGHAEIFGQLANQIAAALEERELPAEPALAGAADRPTRLALEAALRKLNQRGLRVVLVLDEFERLATNAELDVNFFNSLRSIAGRYQVSFLTASARPLIELTFSGRSQEILSSPFFNIFAPLFLGCLEEAEARRLMREPAGRAGVAFGPATEQFLYELAGGHPFALQVACFHAFDTRGNHAETERRTLRELQAHFQYSWHNLTADEQDALRDPGSLAARASGDTALRGLLRDLVQKCLLVAAGQSYRHPSRAWAAFVAGQSASAPDLSTAVLTQPRSNPRPAAGELAAGSLLGPYEVGERLGRGGMAEVYRGRHTRLNRPVAIKVLAAGMAEHADFRERFEREARAVAALSHPNIVQVYDFGDTGGLYYMVMEYIPGSDLARLLATCGPLPLAKARPLARGIAAALDYAHGRGVVHRDVKPSNVMLRHTGEGTGDAQAVLADFGIAKVLADAEAQATRAGVMVGTPDYMAPEQIRASGGLDARADVYAFGTMLFQMLTGRLPFAGASVGEVVQAHLQQPPPDPRSFVPELPTPVAAAILRALAKEPAARPASAGQVATALAET